jgi:hypothetical protein
MVQYRLRCVWLLTLKGKKFFFVMSAIITDDFFHIRLDDVRVCVGISVTSDLSFSSFLFLLFMFEFRGFSVSKIFNLKLFFLTKSGKINQNSKRNNLVHSLYIVPLFHVLHYHLRVWHERRSSQKCKTLVILSWSFQFICYFYGC